MPTDLAQLRRHFDGNDSFMRKGHQLRKLRRAVREPLPWMLSEKEIFAFLLKRFPNIATDSCAQTAAAQWRLAINVCFLMGKTATDAAYEWSDARGLPDSPYFIQHLSSRFRRIVQMIRLADSGLRLDGKKPTGRKRGRPKKNVCTPVTNHGKGSARPLPRCANTV